jgi:hypothetical protein
VGAVLAVQRGLYRTSAFAGFNGFCAYPLIGFTGFIERIALLWWGIELWRTMNLARTSRTTLLRAPFPVATR